MDVDACGDAIAEGAEGSMQPSVLHAASRLPPRDLEALLAALGLDAARGAWTACGVVAALRRAALGLGERVAPAPAPALPRHGTRHGRK